MDHLQRSARLKLGRSNRKVIFDSAHYLASLVYPGMYHLTKRSPRMIQSATRNHTLRYAVLRRQRQLDARQQTNRSLWGSARKNDNDNVDETDASPSTEDVVTPLDRFLQLEKQRILELEHALHNLKRNTLLPPDFPALNSSKKTSSLENVENSAGEGELGTSTPPIVSLDAESQARVIRLSRSNLSPDRAAFIRSYMEQKRSIKDSIESTDKGLDEDGTALGALDRPSSHPRATVLMEEATGSRSLNGTNTSSKVITLPSKSSTSTAKLKTGSNDPEDYPQWFLDNNVILAEESGNRLPAGQIRMIKGTGEEVDIADGHAGLRTLLAQYQTLYEDEEANEDSLDDKVGPFATIPKTLQITGTDASVPHSFLSLPHYLEIALSIASGLAPHSKDQAWSSWGNQRTFLALYSPLDGSSDFLNQIVQAIAKTQQADIIQLSALDLAELSASMPSWENTPFLSSMSSLSYSTHKAFAENQREEREKEDEAEEDNDGQVMAIQLGQPMQFRMDNFKGSRGGRFFRPRDREVLMGQSVKELGLLLDAATAKRATKLAESASPLTDRKRHPLIVCISDFEELYYGELGRAVLKAFEDLVQGRRQKFGQDIMIIGTSSSSETTNKGIATVQEQLDVASENTFYRTLIVPPFQDGRIIDAHVETTPETEAKAMEEDEEQSDAKLTETQDESNTDDTFEIANEPDEAATEDPAAVWEKADAHRIFNINSRHLKAMISQFVGSQATADLDMPLGFDQDTIAQYEIDTQIFSLTEIHRISILTAGMQHIKDSPGQVSPNDVKLAMSMIDANYTETMTPEMEYSEEDLESLTLNPPRVVHDLDSIKAKCTKWEKRLFHCIISPSQLNTTFSKVHTKPETIDALRTLTSMSLLRPDSFSYGVLQSESIPGVLLYGPPGTGKTLLAKAVAKESGATMLAITSSEINHKYVGESEKTVRAIFSLARKLSPCVVFIDEADSLFQSRGAYQSRAGSHETMNQFLSEIEHFGGSAASDGSDNVFLMIATNRPFDLDDAILRRVPRRLLVDLPTEKDREEILKIHLRGEDTSEDVSIRDLANRTPFYSGSDLKNLCVAAALACVRDENAAAKVAREAGDKSFRYPAKRTLSREHFETAIGEISASISEDMGTLTQIRKFDEKYGDRKGRREKTLLGFGQRKVTEDMLRVRI